MISGTAGRCVSVLLPRQLLVLVPGPPGGDDGADVEDLSVFSSCLLATTS